MNKYLQETIEQICQSVRFDSSLAPQEGDYPFGKVTADCLNHFLTLAKSLGFETVNYDNYVGEVVWGTGEDFAILAHLDVVPAGSGWTKDPFGGIVEDGKIWGRGTVDDKGPAICALFAMKSLKDKGFTPNKRIKLIVGCNEESGWKCIDHYKEVATLPETGISPDANFPVIYAEKGISQVKIDFPLQNAPFTAFAGGEKGNMVCDYCSAECDCVDTAKANALRLTVNGNTLSYKGKSAHGSTPDKGVNAIYPLLQYFADSEDISRIIECLFEDCYGLKTLRDETGYLTMSPNIVSFANDTLSFTVDIRYPSTVPATEVFSRIEKFGAKYAILHEQAPLFHDKKSTLIQTLVGVYEECTGEKAEPIAIGGGTYARALKNGVAFGPEFPNKEYAIHQPDEWIGVSDVELLLDIYEKAIERLTK